MLDLAIEVASLARELSTSFQQHQVVGMGPPQRPRRLDAVSLVDFDTPTAQDAGENIASPLVGVDEEDRLAIEYRGARSGGWYMANSLNRSSLWEDLIGFSPWGTDASQEKLEKPRFGNRSLLFFGFSRRRVIGSLRDFTQISLYAGCGCTDTR